MTTPSVLTAPVAGPPRARAGTAAPADGAFAELLHAAAPADVPLAAEGLPGEAAGTHGQVSVAGAPPAPALAVAAAAPTAAAAATELPTPAPGTGSSPSLAPPPADPPSVALTLAGHLDVDRPGVDATPPDVDEPEATIEPGAVLSALELGLLTPVSPQDPLVLHVAPASVAGGAVVDVLREPVSALPGPAWTAATDGAAVEQVVPTNPASRDEGDLLPARLDPLATDDVLPHAPTGSPALTTPPLEPPPGGLPDAGLTGTLGDAAVAVDLTTVPATSAGAAATLTGTTDSLHEAADQAAPQLRPAVAELARGLRDVGGGRASLVVRLDPPELGPVVVRLTVRDGRVDVSVRTGEAVAAVGLAAASADVRSTLAQHGLDLSSFEVEHADLPGGQQAPQQERRESPDRATPRPPSTADRGAGALGAGTGSGLATGTTDGSAVGTWL